MDLGLKGKRAIVNGASQGIGYAIAHRLATEGAAVVVVARREARLVPASDRLRTETGGTIIPVQGDIRRAEDCERIVGDGAKALGGLDILINNDGAPPLGSALEFSDEDWQKAIDQNFMSVLRLTRHAVPHMRAAGGGRIVNIASLTVLQPMAGFGLSVATWAGVIGLAKTLSRELGPDGITINTICPGTIDTPRLRLVYEQSNRSIEDTVAGIPARRIGRPDEIAATAAWLCSEGGAYTNGATLHIDGGSRQNLV
jgi:3-oxoacyl-[acyl-carrier protein] reductase